MSATPRPTAADLRAAESLYEACAAKGRDVALAEIAAALAAQRAPGAAGLAGAVRAVTESGEGVYHDGELYYRVRAPLMEALTAALGATPAPAAGPGAELEAVLAEVIAWAFETFPTSTPVSAATHLLREARELAKAPTSAEEMADCLMLAAHVKARVLQWATRAGVDPARAVADKLAVCRTRTWGPPDADGVQEHDRAAGRPAPKGKRRRREAVQQDLLTATRGGA